MSSTAASIAVPADDAEASRSAAGHDARTRRLLEGPVLATLLRLAAPNLGEAAARVAFISCDALFVSWLGTDALAGVALVFPLLLMTQMISAGGLGSGVAAAVARALGAGEREQAAKLAGQGLLLGLLAAAAIAIGMLAFGPQLYRLMGAQGAALGYAAQYSALVFGAGALVWVMNITANILRGTGVMTVPASAIVLGEAAHLTVSPALILGWGPLPQMGVAGAALGVLATYGVGSAVLLAYLLSGRALVRLRLADLRPARAPLLAILGIGTVSALNVLQFQAAVLLLTGYVGVYGAQALAGFGAALRLEQLQIPIVFAFGSAIIAMIATNQGAGRHERVTRIAWCGTGIAVAIGAVFAAVALSLPGHWLRLFSAEPAVIAAGRDYLRTVGAAYPLMAGALGLFFVCLGLGRIGAPFAAGLLRLAIIGLGGAALLALWQPPAWGLYLVVTDAYVVYGLAMLWAARRNLHRTVSQGAVSQGAVSQGASS